MVVITVNRVATREVMEVVDVVEALVGMYALLHSSSHSSIRCRFHSTEAEEEEVATMVATMVVLTLPPRSLPRTGGVPTKAL